MRMRLIPIAAIALIGIAILDQQTIMQTIISPASAQTAREVPYWASISQPVARMRKGPSENLPVVWEYRREDLPVKVLERYETWRKIEDPDGTVGWMAARLLSAQRSGYVVGGVRPMHVDPSDSSPVAWRAEPGVVGQLSDCTRGWCYFDVKGRRGYIRVGHVWGGEDP